MPFESVDHNPFEDTGSNFESVDHNPFEETKKPTKKPLTASEMASGFAKNFFPSVGREIVKTATGIGEAITKPVETAKAVGKTVYGAVESIPGLPKPKLPLEVDSKQHFDDFISGISDKYKDGKWRETIANNPAEIISDILTFLPSSAVAKIPGVAKLAKAGAAVAKEVPGVETIMKERAATEISGMPDKYRPDINIAKTFKDAKESGETIDVTAFKKTVNDLLDEEEKRFIKAPTVLKKLREISKMPDHMDVGDFHAEMMRARELMEKATKESSGKSQFGRVYTAFHDALTAAEEGSGGQKLKDAIRASRQDFTAQALEDLLSKGVKETEKEGEIDVRPGFLRNNLSRDKDLQAALGPTATKEVMDTLARLKKMPSGYINSATGGVIGGYIGYLVGKGYQGGVIGTAIGYAMPTVISKAVLTKPGRALINKMLDYNKGALRAADMVRLASLLDQQQTSKRDLAKHWSD